MNAKIRKEIAKHIEALIEITDKLESIRDDESEKYDNMPDGLQNSERGEKMQEAIDNLDSTISAIEEAVEYLENI